MVMTDSEKHKMKESAEWLMEFRRALHVAGFGYEGAGELMNSMARGGAFNGI